MKDPFCASKATYLLCMRTCEYPITRTSTYFWIRATVAWRHPLHSQSAVGKPALFVLPIRQWANGFDAKGDTRGEVQLEDPEGGGLFSPRTNGCRPKCCGASILQEDAGMYTDTALTFFLHFIARRMPFSSSVCVLFLGSGAAI